MPRSPYIISSETPYHVSARCHNKDWFQLPISEVWKIMSEQLYFAHHAFGVKIHSFVLMSNHFHLLLRTPQGNLSETMRYFMREVSREVSRQTGHINQTFGARYHRTLIGSSHYFFNAYKYIYRNPVEAGLAKFVEDYPFSTLHGLLRGSHSLIPLEEDTLLFDTREITQILTWLNHPVSDENKLALKRALRKREFSLALTKHQKAHRLETELY